jgi:hypothetical protein
MNALDHGVEYIAQPTLGPDQTLGRFLTSLGSNASPMSWARSAETAGVNSEGLTTARFPAARTPASGPNTHTIGKFHGPMTPTTPSGLNSTRA